MKAERHLFNASDAKVPARVLEAEEQQLLMGFRAYTPSIHLPRAGERAGAT